MGIRVIAETHPEALEILDHFTGREIFRPVEGHVLEEVGEPLLVVVLHERSGVDEEAHADAIRRFGVREDGVAQPVFEQSPFHRRIGGDVAALVSEGDRVGGGEEAGKSCSEQAEQGEGAEHHE